MDQNIIANIDEDSEPKYLNKKKMKQLIIYISAGFLFLFLLFSIIAFATGNNGKKKIILENKAKIETIEENVVSKDLLEENGYYYCIDFEEKYNKVFRFYKASNKVIGASIGSTLSEIRFKNLFPSENWFNEYYKDNARYEITTSGNKIAFKVGNVHYKGTLLEGQKIELFSHSDINGHEDTKVFKFISLDVLEDIKKLDKNDN
jgi:hypothetical protein